MAATHAQRNPDFIGGPDAEQQEQRVGAFLSPKQYVEESPVAGLFTLTHAISCMEVTAKYKPYHPNPINHNSTTPYSIRHVNRPTAKICNRRCHSQLLNSRRHHARTDIAMRDELSDMDYPTYPK